MSGYIEKGGAPRSGGPLSLRAPKFSAGARAPMVRAPQISLDAVGKPFDDLMRTADKLGDYGQLLVKRALDKRDEDDAVLVTKAYEDGRKEADEVLWNPEKGYITREGFNAYNPSSEEPVSVSKDTSKLMQDLGEKYSEKLNDRQLKLFNEQWKTLGRDYVNKMLKHELKQRNAVRDVQFQTAVSGLKDSVATLPLNEVENFITGPQGLQRVNGFIERTYGSLGGLAVAKMKADTEAEIRSGVLARLSNDPTTLDAADEYVDIHKDVLGDMYPKLRDDVDDKIIKADENAQKIHEERQDELATKFKLGFTDANITSAKAKALLAQATLAHARGYLNDDNLLALRKASKAASGDADEALKVSKSLASKNEVMLMDMRRTGRSATARAQADRMYSNGEITRATWLMHQSELPEKSGPFEAKAKRVKPLVSGLFRGSLFIVDEDLNQRRNLAEAEYEVRVWQNGEDPYDVYRELREKEYASSQVQRPVGYDGEMTIQGLKEHAQKLAEQLSNGELDIRDYQDYSYQTNGAIDRIHQREEEKRTIEQLFGDTK